MVFHDVSTRHCGKNQKFWFLIKLLQGLNTREEIAMLTSLGSTSLKSFTPTKEQIDEYARSQGFPNSDYPYYEKVNSCGSGEYCKWVPDGWYPVSFNNACNNHDRCYMTCGTSQDECDNKFYEDLKAAIKRDLSQNTKNIPLVFSPIPMKTVVGGFRGDFKPTPIDFGIYQLSAVAGLAPPVPLPIGTVLPRKVDAIEPTSLVRGLKVAEIYYRVVKGAGGSYHQNSQIQAKKYKELVETYIRRCQRPQILSLEAVADSYIRADYDVRKNDNYGHDRNMNVGTGRGSSVGPYGTADAMRSLVRFDLVDIQGPIQEAVLELSILGVNSRTDSPFTVGVYRINQPWQEGNGAESYAEYIPDTVSPDAASGIAWEKLDPENYDQPDFDPECFSVARVYPNSAKHGDVVAWDITSLVQQWVNDPSSNFGLMLRDTTTDGNFRELAFGTRECDLYTYPDKVRGPRLVVQQ